MSIHSSSSDPDPKLSRVRLHQIKPYLRSLYSTTVCYDDFILNLADLWCTFYLLALFNYVLSSQFNNVKKKSISSAINGNSRYVFLASCIMRHLYIGFQWLTSDRFYSLLTQYFVVSAVSYVVLKTVMSPISNCYTPVTFYSTVFLSLLT